ncbi:MAG: hypothetical protein EOO66_18005 [Methylobacterium sp.]|nr:MAG: hypothetical protein EOO66_18005 [Methylobacterium sp.]
MTGDWIQLLLSTLLGVSTLFAVLATGAIGPRAVRRVVCTPSVGARASAGDRRSTWLSIVALDSLLAPAPMAAAPLPPREDVTRRRRSAALPPPPPGPRPRVVGT